MDKHDELADSTKAQVVEFTPPLPCCAVITYIDDEEILCHQPATVGFAIHEAGLVGEGEHW